MEKQIAVLHATLLQMDERQQQMMDLLENHLLSINRVFSASAAVKKPVPKKKESREIRLKRKELKKKLPPQLTTTDTIDAIEISRANFYRNVYKIFLFPDYSKGKQPYYRRSDVIEFVIHVIHEPGAHTFFKAKKKLLSEKKQ